MIIKKERGEEVVLASILPAREVGGQAGGEGVEHAPDVDGVAADVGAQVAVAERGREFRRVRLLLCVQQGSGVDSSQANANQLKDKFINRSSLIRAG